MLTHNGINQTSQFFRQVFTSSTSINNFSAMQCCRERNKWKLFAAMSKLCGSWWVDLLCAYERCRAWVNVRNFTPESIGDNKHHKLTLSSFLKAYHEDDQRKSRKCREWTSRHTSSFLATAWSHGDSIKLTNEITKGLQFAAFRDYGSGIRWEVSTLTTFSYSQAVSTASALCFLNG